LQAAAAEVVSHRIENVARSVGAPTVTSGKKCPVNIEVFFTAEPQALLDRIAATKYRPLFGYYRKSELKQVTTFNHPVQACYMTGTRSIDAGLPIVGLSPGITSILITGLKADSAATDGSLGFGRSGNPGSRLTTGAEGLSGTPPRERITMTERITRAESLPATAVVRVSRASYDPSRFAEVDAASKKTSEYLIPSVRRLPGLIHFYAGISPKGSIVQVSIWDTDEHAAQLDRLKEMVVDGRREMEAVGVTFSRIFNYPIDWTWTG
jgi:hypothetical protein